MTRQPITRHGRDHRAVGSDPIPFIVTDGTHTVSPAGEISFTSGATVTDAGGGVAQVAVSGGGGGGGGTEQVPVHLSTPDSSANGYPALTLNNGFSNVRRIVPAFTHGVDGYWTGVVRVPQDYSSGGKIVVSYVANASSGALRNRVSTSVVAAASSEDAAWTDESYVNTTVPGTAKQRFDVSFTLTTTPAAGSTLNVKVTRNGASGSDTLTVDALLWECLFEYTS